ncbi:erythroblast NAD(P)(+)--arginine ADP-ribosyltransferase-like [Boleophthalmus pectinirostris]|uniref:erythroblast NAD(P)(+)--arginine ADP-ribosyltransferase-like n=1 Tax=Boleophthalmus pectinirostris TaxID=150288 RepID=UPI0024310567|nr:erythroblast NAD(P)(+)--arginine ADP-ribosyltransferase-like [Boleophthalmus pectinirostris]
MKTTVMFLMFCLVAITVLPVERVKGKIPLSMMEQSVDDMYDGCSEATAEKVKNEYFPREMNNNKLFKDAWKDKESCAEIKYNTRDNTALTKDQIHALCIYTGDVPKVYQPFNKAVRESAAYYKTNSFKYHALHYWLTTALQTLNIAKTCYTTYHRSKQTFTGQLNQVIRFGYFTSTSTNPNLVHFGTQTCFHIETCLGAPIKKYSVNRNEDEVLIPPYETFKITHIEEGSDPKYCKQIFVLKNAGSESKLNCATAPPKPPKQGCYKAIKAMIGKAFSGCS